MVVRRLSTKKDDFDDSIGIKELGWTKKGMRAPVIWIIVITLALAFYHCYEAYSEHKEMEQL